MEADGEPFAAPHSAALAAPSSDLKGTFLLPDAFWVIWADSIHVESTIRLGAHELLVFGRISGISDR